MATNFPGPFQVRIFYTANSRQHVQRLDCDMDIEGDPGQSFIYWTPNNNGASPILTLEEAVDAWVALMQPAFKTTDEISRAELWKYADASNDAAYQSVYTLGVNGTSASPNVLNGEQIFTFRSSNGGSKRIHFFDGIQPWGATQAWPFSTTWAYNIGEYVVGGDGWFVARDNGRLFAPLNFLPGSNEHWFKDYYR